MSEGGYVVQKYGDFCFAKLPYFQHRCVLYVERSQSRDTIPNYLLNSVELIVLQKCCLLAVVDEKRQVNHIFFLLLDIITFFCDCSEHYKHTARAEIRAHYAKQKLVHIYVNSMHIQ